MSDGDSLPPSYNHSANQSALPSARSTGSIKNFLNTEIKDFKKKLRDQHGHALNKLLNQLVIGESSYRRNREAREARRKSSHNSASFVTSPFREQLAEGMGEDDVLDLISAPIDSQTILQYYKTG